MIGLLPLDGEHREVIERIDDIASIALEEGVDVGVFPYRVVFRDGEVRKVTLDTYQRIVSHPLQLMPAQPGVYALKAYFETGTGEVEKTPVIAWARCVDGSIRIVTPQGVDDGHEWADGRGYVLMPDGSVQAVGEEYAVGGFASVEAYLLYRTHEYQDRREARS